VAEYKKIIQLTQDNIFVKEWNSVIEIEDKLNIRRQDIRRVCLGKRQSTCGYKWKYKNK